MYFVRTVISLIVIGLTIYSCDYLTSKWYYIATGIIELILLIVSVYIDLKEFKNDGNDNYQCFN
jgi:hypothetical protein